MEILFVSAWFPFPQDTGSRIRIYHLLRALRECHRVHLVAFLPSAKERAYLPATEALCASVSVVERDPFWRNPHLRLSAHFSLTPRDVLRSYSPEINRLVADSVRRKAFDVIIASTLEAAPYVLQATGVPRILEEHNFTTDWMQERYLDQGDPIRKTTAWITWQKCQRYERQLYPHFQAVTMVSERDRQAVKKIMPEYSGRLEVIPNGVDLESCQLGLAPPLPETIVFNGSLTYAANLEAMHWFVGQVLPLIRRKCPEVLLVITGRTEGVEPGWLLGDASIRLTGYLEDIRPAVAGSWLAVAPLLSGGGTRLKILEAMALRTPVVATCKGAEGLVITPGADVLIADSPDDFAAECLRLMENPGLRQEIIKNARRLVEQHYGWQAIGEEFRRLVEETAGK